MTHFEALVHGLTVMIGIATDIYIMLLITAWLAQRFNFPQQDFFGKIINPALQAVGRITDRQYSTARAICIAIGGLLLLRFISTALLNDITRLIN